MIGEILGREQPGVGDTLLANRLRVLLERGEFRMVQEDPPILPLCGRAGAMRRQVWFIC